MSQSFIAESPRPARLRDTPRAAWIIARAFTHDSRIGRRLPGRTLHIVHAVLAMPLFLMVALSYVAAGQAYLDDARVGFVILSPRSPNARETGGWAVTFVALVLVLVTYGLVLAPIPYLPLAVGAVVLLSSVLTIDAMRSDRLPRDERRRLRHAGVTPPDGPRWTLSLLAKIPGTGVTASRLAHRVLHRVPPAGAVVLATARTPALHAQYAAHGFTPATGSRLFYVVPTTRCRTVNGSI